MKEQLRDQKAKLKEDLGKKIDRYFEAFENSSNQKDFDINVIEKLMLESQRNLKTVMNEANSDLASSMDAGVKKTAKNAKVH